MTLNIFDNIPAKLPDELIEVLLENDNIRIERIVSRGHSSQPGHWYDQGMNEFVLLLKGEASLRFEKDDRALNLKAGDHLIIPAHKKHRVDMTSSDEDAVWLAVHY